MALRKILILRRPRSGRLEGPTALIQQKVDFFTRSQAGTQSLPLGSRFRGNDD